MWGDKEVKTKLLRKGILTRIYSPMVSIYSAIHYTNFQTPVLEYRVLASLIVKRYLHWW